MINNKLLCQRQRNCVILKKRKDLTIYIDELKDLLTFMNMEKR
jgi:hypothetical protein